MPFRVLPILVVLTVVETGAGVPPGDRTAQETPPQPSPAPASAAEIIEVLQRSTEGWNAGDLDAFMAPYDESSTFMTAGGPIDRAATRERYAGGYFAGGRPAQRLTFDELDVRMLGADAALMTGRFVLRGGGKPDATGRFTLVWRRRPAGWKIVHDHTS
jgi:beta-aspartyl-peptidase (threonine type)